MRSSDSRRPDPRRPAPRRFDLRRSLLALPTLQLRLARMREWFEGGALDLIAPELERLCADAERADVAAREALVPVALYFAALGDELRRAALHAFAVERGLLALERLLRPGPQPLAQDRKAEELPVPDYGTGRELTVGERRALARRPDRAALERLVQDPHPLVIRQLLENPRLTEDELITLATRRPARVELLQEITRAPRWICRNRVRLALVLNPGAPPELATPLVALCNRAELAVIVQTSTLPPQRRALAREWFDKRPPIAEDVAASERVWIQ